MSHVYVIGDLHFGHKNIHQFREGFCSEIEHRKHLMQRWRETVSKNDTVYVLGDAAFTQEGLVSIADLPGRKHLVRGNHDQLPTLAYLAVFKEIYGLLKYKGYWLSHAPIHPQELRGRANVHGHTHKNNVPDARYINVSAEQLDDYAPIRFEQVVMMVEPLQ